MQGPVLTAFIQSWGQGAGAQTQHVLKGHQKFSPPITIKKQAGPSTYSLVNGKTWHASHLTSVPLVEAQFRQTLNGKKKLSQ